MSFEFVHTSVERGLRGDSGFAIAVLTRGLPPALEPALAELSAYDFDSNRAVGADRTDWAHRILSAQGKSYTVLSRTAPCGNDWSGRPNRIAHHLVVDPSHRAPAGPAWMLAHFAGFHGSAPAVRECPMGPSLPSGHESARPADAWHVAGFDRGWAGVIAQTLLDAPQSTCCVVLPSEVDGLPLVLDVLALIPADKRWFVTFSTRFQRLPSGGRCQLRLLRADASGVRAMLAEPGVRAVEVKRGVSAGESAAAIAAREGREIGASMPLAIPPRITAPKQVAAVQPVRPTRPIAEQSVSVPKDESNVAEQSLGWVVTGTTGRDEPDEIGEDLQPVPTRPAYSPQRTEPPDPIVIALFIYSAAAFAVAIGLFLA